MGVEQGMALGASFFWVSTRRWRGSVGCRVPVGVEHMGVDRVLVVYPRWSVTGSEKELSKPLVINGSVWAFRFRPELTDPRLFSFPVRVLAHLRSLPLLVWFAGQRPACPLWLRSPLR